MPANYTGKDTTTVPHAVPVITCPVDGDPGNAASVNTPLQQLADIVAFIQKYATFMGAGAGNEGTLELDGDIVATGDLDVGQAHINSALVVTGEADIANRIKSGPPINSTYLKLVAEHPGYGTGAGSIRRYVAGAGVTLRLYEAVNASSEEGEWARIDAALPAVIVETSGAGVRVYTLAVGETTWRGLQISSSGLAWVDTAATAAGANPAAGTAIKNELRAKNVPKAWGTVEVVSGVVTVLDGFNVGSVTLGSHGGVLVTLAEPFSGDDYCVVATPINTPRLIMPSYLKAGSFEIVQTVGFDLVNDLIDPSAVNCSFSFAAYGAQ